MKGGHAIAGPRGRHPPHSASACSPSSPCCCAWCSRPAERLRVHEYYTDQARRSRWPSQASRTSSSCGATTSAGGTSATTTAARWATGPPTSTASANEGATFTDYYGQQSCTAGRAAFITGQNPIRTGLTKVGMPGADVGLRAEDPTIAELLKPLGYATGQFGKNHLGRQGRVPADGARLRRVLRQSLSPECRGGAGAAGLSEGPGVQEAVRPAAACCTAGPTARAGRRSRTPGR